MTSALLPQGTQEIRMMRAATPEVSVRQLRTGEKETITAVFAAMTPEQRAARYRTGMPRLPEWLRRYLAEVDEHSHVAYVAMLDEEPIGIARYVLVGPATVEVAVEVAHDYVGRGVATMLLSHLRRHAEREGVRLVTVEVHPANVRALHLARRNGVRLRAHRGEVQGTLDLTISDNPSQNWPVTKSA